MPAGEEGDKFRELLGKLSELENQTNDHGFELVRKWPGLAFVKEYYETKDIIVMQEISDVYDRRIIPRHLYKGRTDWDAGTPEQKLWKYEDAVVFNRNDLEALHRNTPIFVQNESWTSSFTGESGVWTGLKIWTRGERTLMWGFEFNAEWG